MNTPHAHAPPLRLTRLAPATRCLLAVLCMAPAHGASLSSVDDLTASKARAQAGLVADRAACDNLGGNARDVCREQARGKERVAKAELDLAHTGSRESQDRVTAVKLDAAYDIARTRCNAQTGSAKTVCTKEARDDRAKGHIRLARQQPTPIGTDDRREADYRAAAQKCGGMAVDARAGCLAAAKAGHH